jgi:hypothetical protein
MAGFGLNLKLVLYLQNQCLIESLGFLTPPHRQAAKRYKPFIPNELKTKYEINFYRINFFDNIFL